MQPQQYPPQGQPTQGYAPQPQYQPNATQAYGQQYPVPQQPVPAPQVAPMQPFGSSAGGEDFSNPEMRGNSPRWADLVGRLLLIEPTKLERNVPNRLARPDANGQIPTQDRMTLVLTVLDGPPFTYGGKPKEGIPDHLQASAPAEFRGALTSHAIIIAQCEAKLPGAAGPGGRVLGRFGFSDRAPSQPGQSRAYRLTEPTEEDKALARQWLAHKAGAAITGPTAQQQFGPQQSQAWPMQAPPAGFPAQATADPGAYLQGQAQAYVPPPQALQSGAAATAPAGWDPGVWATLNPAQQAQILGQAPQAASPGW